MKKAFTVITAALVSFAFWGCSDDSSAENSTEVVVEDLPDDIPDGTPADGGEGGGNTEDKSGDKSGDGSGDKSDGKKPDGSGAPVNMGFAEAGPFLAGASVSMTAVDPSTLKASGEPLKTTVASNRGDFAFSETLGSAYASLEASGRFYHYANNDTASSVKLNAYTNLTGRTTANVNILTHLEYARVNHLVTEEGKSFADAKKNAESEILAAFHMTVDTTRFEDISLGSSGTAARNLLAVTSILLGERNGEQISSLLASISGDIGSDGKWDSDSLKAALADEAYVMSVDYLANILATRLGVGAVESFESAVMEFWAQEYGIGSCTDSTDGVIKQNTNKKSKNYERYFKCGNKGWLVMSEALVKSMELSKVFGECDDKSAGTIKEDSNSDSYICHKDIWRLATEAELEIKAVADAKGACTAENNSSVVQYNSAYFVCSSKTWKKLARTPIDYSKGRKMNARLGRGINLGNAWESAGGSGATADCGWNNCIEDGYFKIVKDAGFNSIRLPVRWPADAGRSEPYTLDAGRLSGVKADIDLAIAQGLAVIVNIHHYMEMNNAAANYKKSKDNYDKEKARMLGIWAQVAKELDSYPDSLLVLEIFNEPHDMDMEQLNDIMTSAYKVIRENAPGKTIMFESNGYSKFAQIKNLTMPDDGNVIVSGHYYEPYTITHQGHGYDCNNSLSGWTSSVVTSHFSDYVQSVMEAFPDVNGGYIPMNVGEFGVSGQNGSSCGGNGVSDELRAKWTDAVIVEAEKYGMSWHYWGFVGVGGFEAYDKWAGKWYPELLAVFDKYIKK